MLNEVNNKNVPREVIYVKIISTKFRVKYRRDNSAKVRTRAFFIRKS